MSRISVELDTTNMRHVFTFINVAFS